MDIRNLKVGDRIEFKACTRSHYRKAIRKITEITDGRVRVRYHGYGDFVLKSSEIIRLVEPDRETIEQAAIRLGTPSIESQLDKGLV